MFYALKLSPSPIILPFQKVFIKKSEWFTEPRKVSPKEYFRFVFNGEAENQKSRQKIKYILMALKWYQCKNCAMAIKKDSTPSTSGCSVKSSHTWSRLGEVGDTNYSCKKCGTLVQTKSTPSTLGCPQASSHSLRKL